LLEPSITLIADPLNYPFRIQVAFRFFLKENDLELLDCKTVFYAAAGIPLLIEFLPNWLSAVAKTSRESSMG
jgi:hypothetical protein